ncbi:MAG: hypothetical protein JXR94_20980 [Candidatus Hydrogenedentes bacterium]|nr:hypothetical protein [Candidatus Hydrogenedentota bacterium]
MMDAATAIHITGASVPETTKALATRLIELGRPVEVIDSALAERIGGAAGANEVSGLLSRNGVVVLAVYDGAQPAGDTLAVEVDPNDTPDFAAEKILDLLDEAGVVDLESTEYTPAEEEQIRRRLADLGYVE